MNYREICELLSSAGIENAQAEAGLLLEHFCGVRASELIFRKCEDFCDQALQDAVQRRIRREPLQYLLGEWEFFGLPFSVSPDCLIPRPDTELLVELAIKYLPAGAYFADFCTGSGCIVTAVLANRPDTTAVAVDAFENTLEMARKNCQANGVGERVTLVLRDLLQPMDGAFEPKFDCILSNPPYIPTKATCGSCASSGARPLTTFVGM